MNSQDSKTLNKARIFKLVCIHGAMSRLDMHRCTGFSKMTITNLVGEFLDAGIMRATGTDGTGVGRRAELIEVVPESMLTIGVLITHHGLYVAPVALDGSYDTLNQKHLAPDDTAETLFQKICACIDNILAAKQSSRFAAIVISTMGYVEVETNTLELGAFFPAVGRVTDVDERLGSRYGLPIFAENDANVSALAELYFGRKDEKENFIYVQIDEGMGAGLVINGSLFSEVNSFAGELGHMTIVHGGLPCKCGNCGCLERYASTTAACEWYGEHAGKSDIFWEILIESARNGDKLAKEAIERAGHFLASGLVNLINIIEADRIYIGDKGMDMLPFIQDSLENEVNERRLRQRRISVLPASFQMDARLMGVASLLIERQTEMH